MKSVQFKLDEDKYEKAKVKLQEVGLTWQKVCEQLSDHIIYSGNLDEFGIPLLEMAPSVLKQAQAQIEGHIETALWKYIQLQLHPSGRDRNHWMQGLKAALKQLMRSNTNRNWKRGYIFDKDEMEQFLKDMFPLSVRIAAGHLGIEQREIKTKSPSLDELFQFAGMQLRMGK